EALDAEAPAGRAHRGLEAPQRQPRTRGDNRVVVEELGGLRRGRRRVRGGAVGQAQEAFHVLHRLRPAMPSEDFCVERTAMLKPPSATARTTIVTETSTRVIPRALPLRLRSI